MLGGASWVRRALVDRDPVIGAVARIMRRDAIGHYVDHRAMVVGSMEILLIVWCRDIRDRRVSVQPNNSIIQTRAKEWCGS